MVIRRRGTRLACPAVISDSSSVSDIDGELHEFDTMLEGGRSGFVMVDRSLWEVEKLEDWILIIATAVWFVFARGSLVIFGLLMWLATKFYGLRR